MTERRSSKPAPASTTRWWLAAGLLSGCTSIPLYPVPASTPAPKPAPAASAPQPAPAPALAAPPAVRLPPAVPVPVDPTENPVVAARFPEPAVSFNTPAFQAGRTTFTSEAELRTWLRAQVRSTGAVEVKLLTLGDSQDGTPLEALVFAKATNAAAPGPATAASAVPAAAVRGVRPTVVLIAQQHGDEPAAGEALLVVAEELTRGRLQNVLDRIDVVVVPRANPDGALTGRRTTANGIDLNRDHLLLRTPEARALARLMREYQPLVVVDAHEYPAVGPYVDQFGALPRYDVLSQYAMTPQLHPFVRKASDEWFRQPMWNALKKDGYSVEWYHQPSTDSTDKRLSMGGPGPDIGRNVNGLRHAVSLLIEGRGVGIGRQHFKRRVQSQVVAISSVLREAARRADDLQKLRHYVDADVAAQACRGRVVIEAATTLTEYRLTMIDPRTGEDRVVPVGWNSALALDDLQSRPRPCGYWLAADQALAVDTLRALGLTVMQLTENGVVQGEAASTGVPRAGGRAPDRARALIDVPTGSFYVPLTQPLANLAVAALEADTPFGFSAAGLVTAPDRQMRVLALPEVRMTAVP
jgi:hypothetical protein